MKASEEIEAIADNWDGETWAVVQALSHLARAVEEATEAVRELKPPEYDIDADPETGIVTMRRKDTSQKASLCDSPVSGSCANMSCDGTAIISRSVLGCAVHLCAACERRWPTV